MFYFNSQNAIVLYFSETCPHCVSFMPLWDQLVKRNPGVSFVKTDVVPDTIKTVPTIVKNKNGVSIVFDGNRTLEELEAFIKK